MVDMTILAMTEDQGWLASFWSAAQQLKRSRLVATSSMGEAFDLLDCAGARLLVLDPRAGTFTVEELDRLLWANSTLAQPALVLIIDQTYSPEDALDLFRMGVDEYVCSSLHDAQMTDIVTQLLSESSERDTQAPLALPLFPKSTRTTVAGSARPAAVALA